MGVDMPIAVIYVHANYICGDKWTLSSRSRGQGLQGCRNVRAGGDNVKAPVGPDDVFMCYIVYRSFAVKPVP